MKEHIRELNNIVQTTIDSETGEVLDQEVIKKKIYIGKEEFTQIYTKFWIALTSSKSSPEIELLAYLINKYGNGAEFTVTKSIKQRLAQTTGRVNYRTYENAIPKLVQKQLLIKVSGSSGVYRINPVLVFKGSSETRKRFIVETCESQNFLNNLLE